jgi:NAD(P)-dependent dehydrogenase (short-subunit alcohol dehydrogenase family)
VGGLCDGRVVIVTGGGRGLGRAHALMLAAQGALVMVNDLGSARDGSSTDEDPAANVVAEITGAGGVAVASTDDVSDFDSARNLVRSAIARFGTLHAVVNNAGFVRDHMIVNMTEHDWDAVIRVNLKGTFGPTRWAAEYWRDQAKAGALVDARIVNTTSIAGIYGFAGMANYAAAKAGVAAFSIMAAAELARYGVTVNAIAPTALTRTTVNMRLDQLPTPDPDKLDPDWCSAVMCWLVSEQSAGVTGKTFEVSGHGLSVAESWHRGPCAEASRDAGDIDSIVRALLPRVRPHAGNNGVDGAYPHTLTELLPTHTRLRAPAPTDTETTARK